VDRPTDAISVVRQCQLLDVNRSSVYYQPQPESDLNLAVMRRIDEVYTDCPFYGSPRITALLQQEGFPVGHKRIERLMRRMGIQAIYPKKKTTVAAPENRVYPYLLRGVAIERADQVWSTDITYIRTARGFVYLAAVMDWFSRLVISWSVSTTMDVGFCLEALDTALTRGRPEIFNSDQGSQFTSLEFTRRLLDAGVAISMDGRGRAFDNIFIERLWRTVKYEEVYLRDYQGASDARGNLDAYLSFYNERRLHQALGYRTPQQAYAEAGGCALSSRHARSGRL
jgi:putative transposase